MQQRSKRCAVIADLASGVPDLPEPVETALLKNHKPSINVILGANAVRAFVTAPKEFKVIGIVRMSHEFGLLAIAPSGNYVRVNGSQIESLNNGEVRAAIQLFLSNVRERNRRML